MASRTLPRERDRKMTILLTPFMSCSAKLPIYACLRRLLPRDGALVMVGLYFLGILMGILYGLSAQGTLFKGEAVPFVMELPNYRLPGLKNVAQLLWEKAKDFLERAFTVIFLATIIIWFLQNFDLQLSLVADSAGQHPGLDRQRHRAVVRPAGLWRLAGVHGADQRLYGKGERRLHPYHPVWLLCRTGRGAQPGGSGSPAGVLPALHPLHRRCGIGQAGDGRPLGHRYGREPVRCGMACRAHCAVPRRGGAVTLS